MLLVTQRRCSVIKMAIVACFLLHTNCHAKDSNESNFNNQKSEKYNSISWLKRIADKGTQEASLKTKSDKYDFKRMFSDDLFDMDTLRKTSFEIMDTGIPSKVGYGFLMGYTSGFCLKKVCVEGLWCGVVWSSGRTWYVMCGMNAWQGV